jgi:GTP-dependent phosphoenolpyruvate carboxykinase
MFFICSDTPDEIAYVKNMAVVSGEEKMLLTPGHTYHFDGIYDQGRDRAVTKFLVPKGEKLSQKLNQIDRDEGLNEILNLFRKSMQGKTMIVLFGSLGPVNSVFFERVKKFWENEEDVPSEIFNVLEEQKQRLLLAQKEFGNYISPENFEIVD